MKDIYKVGEHLVGTVKARKILEEKRVLISDEDRRDDIDICLDLGYITLAYVFEANDYVHGPYETYMLRQNGIVIIQPNPLDIYVVYHLVEVGYTVCNE